MRGKHELAILVGIPRLGWQFGPRRGERIAPLSIRLARANTQSLVLELLRIREMVE